MSVSVCIPTYNQGAYIGQTIKSIVNQTVQPIEIIVSNDCSTDNTKALLADLQKDVPLLKVINQPKNLGISANVDFCLKQATGDYVLRIDSDDMLKPGYIEQLSAMLDQYPDAGYAHAAVQEIDKNGRELNLRKLARPTGYQHADEALKAGVKGYRVAANILMFRKAALQKVGYVVSKIDFAEDYYLAVQIAAAGFGNVYNQETLACYRVWTDTGKVRQRRKLAEIKGLTAVFNEVIEPAFKQRRWDTGAIAKARESSAIAQSDCLGWDVYTDSEKSELENALLNLSDSENAKKFYNIHRKGLGFIVNAWSGLMNKMRVVVKNIIYRK